MFDTDIMDIASQHPGTFPFMGRMRYTDINIDGFPDIFITLNFYNTVLGS